MRRDKAFDADINRMVLGFLTGADMSQVKIARKDLAETVLTPFLQQLQEKSITLNLFSVRIYQYGPNYRAATLNFEAKRNIHKNYTANIDEAGNIVDHISNQDVLTAPMYAPTALAVQRYEDGTPYVVFEGMVDANKDCFVLSSDITPDMVETSKDFFREIGSILRV